MNIKVQTPFFKVIVLSVEIFETRITDERHFSDKDSAASYVKALPSGMVGVIVEL